MERGEEYERGKESNNDREIGTHQKGDKTYTPLWSQKFFHAKLEELKFHTIENALGYNFGSSYLENAMLYISQNRKKHHLPESHELKEIIESLTVSMDAAFGVV